MYGLHGLIRLCSILFPTGHGVQGMVYKDFLGSIIIQTWTQTISGQAYEAQLEARQVW